MTWDELVRVLETLKDVDAEKVVEELKEKGAGVRLYLTPHYHEIHREYLVELDQKENFCGPFAAAIILRGLGFREHKGEKVDQDYLAVLARVNVSPSDLERLRKLREKAESLPPEEAEKLAEANREIWYRFQDFPTTTKSQELGASAEGVAHAILEASGNALAVVPIKTYDRRDGALLRGEGLKAFHSLLREVPRLQAQLILNLNTRHLLDSEKIPRLSEKLLLGEPYPNILRNPVGHFVSSGGLIEVDDRGLVVIRETYRIYGAHLQPLERVGEALCREDGREGGVLLIVPRRVEAEARRLVEGLGLRVGLWDNGSPYIPATSQQTF